MRILLLYGNNGMLYLISYDVSTETPEGRRRLRHVARACENYGIRVQNSVFECELPYSAYISFKAQLAGLIEKKADSLRIYPLGKQGRSKIVHMGVNRAVDVTAPLII